MQLWFVSSAKCTLVFVCVCETVGVLARSLMNTDTSHPYLTLLLLFTFDPVDKRGCKCWLRISFCCLYVNKSSLIQLYTSDLPLPLFFYLVLIVITSFSGWGLSTAVLGGNTIWKLSLTLQWGYSHRHCSCSHFKPLFISFKLSFKFTSINGRRATEQEALMSCAHVKF